MILFLLSVGCIAVSVLRCFLKGRKFTEYFLLRGASAGQAGTCPPGWGGPRHWQDKCFRLNQRCDSRQQRLLCGSGRCRGAVGDGLFAVRKAGMVLSTLCPCRGGTPNFSVRIELSQFGEHSSIGVGEAFRQYIKSPVIATHIDEGLPSGVPFLPSAAMRRSEQPAVGCVP